LSRATSATGMELSSKRHLASRPFVGRPRGAPRTLDAVGRVAGGVRGAAATVVGAAASGGLPAGMDSRGGGGGGGGGVPGVSTLTVCWPASMSRMQGPRSQRRIPSINTLAWPSSAPSVRTTSESLAGRWVSSGATMPPASPESRTTMGTPAQRSIASARGTSRHTRVLPIAARRMERRAGALSTRVAALS
jgi:hypothetical protein